MLVRAARQAHGRGEDLLVAAGLDSLADVARGIQLGILADLGVHGVAVHEHGHGRAGAVGRGSRGQGTGDDAGGVAVLGVHIHVAAGGSDLHAPAHAGLHVVIGHDHGEGARQGGRSAAGDGPRDSLGIGVLAGQEVQAVHGVEQFLAVEIDGDLVVLVVLALVEVDEAGVGALALGVAQLAGIRDQIAHIDQVLEVLRGDFLLLGVELEAVRLDGGVVPHLRADAVAGDDIGGSDAHTHGRAGGQAQAARTCGDLGLVGGLHGDIAALDGAVLSLGAAGDVNSGLAIADHDAHRAGDGGRAALAGHGTRQGLGRKLALEVAIHVLGELAGDRHIFLVRGFEVAIDPDAGLVAVDAHRHAHGDGVGLLRQGHGRAGAHGVEVAGVLGGGLDLLACDDLAHLGAGLVAGDGQAHRGGHFDLLLLLLLVHAEGAAHLPGDLAHCAACLRGAFLAVLRLDLLRAQHIAGRGRAALCGLARVALLLVQAVVDLVGGLVVLLVLGLVQIGAVEDLVALLFEGLRGVADLARHTGHIRAHGGGKRLGGVLAVTIRGNGGIAVHGGVAGHLRLDAAVGDVDGHARADRRLSAHGEGRGGRFGGGYFLCRYVQIAGLLLFAVRITLYAGGAGFVLRLDIGIQNVQRHGSVQSEFLGIIRVQVAGQGIGAGGAGDILQVGGCRVHIQRAGGHGTGPLADLGLGPGIAVDHGERRANAHAGPVLVLCDSGGFPGRLLLLALDQGDQQRVHIAVGHGEGVDDLLFIGGDHRERLLLAGGGAGGGIELHLVNLAFGVSVGIAHAVQHAALLFGDPDLDGFTRAGGDGIVVVDLAVLDSHGHRALFNVLV